MRFIIIGILLFIAYRLIFGGKKSEIPPKSSSAEKKAPQAVEDVLVEDPVCHALVPRQQAVQLRHKNKMIYFCSQKCCDTFIEDKGDE